jgi:phenylacetate-CoA ligase
MARAGVWLAHRWRIPYIQTVEDFLPHGGRLRVSRRWCRGLVAPCQELAYDLVHNLGVPAHLLCIVPPAVPCDLDPAKRSVASSDRPRVPVIGTAGPFVEGAGLITFLKAARLVVEAGRDAEFVIAGRGPREAELRRAAERLRISDRVTFAEETGGTGALWSVLDIYCHTSLVPTVGRTLTLALAHGIPAVASDVEGLRPPAADESTGLRVPPGNADALAQAIVALLADPARGRALGHLGRAWAAGSFNPDREAALLADLYHRVAPAPACTTSTAQVG